MLSKPALTVKVRRTKGSTSTPLDAFLMCVDRHSGYLVAAATTEEGLIGQRAAQVLYCNQFKVK